MNTAKKSPKNLARKQEKKADEHIPVLVSQVRHFLAPAPGKRFIDATLGGGGHTEAILKAGGEVFAIDLDPEAIKLARKRLVSACPPSAFSWTLCQGNFAHLKKLVAATDFSQVDGILFDLGLSSYQLASERGFSFAQDEPLDMRMDPELGVTAADLVNALSEYELYQILTRFSQEKRARAIAGAIVRARRVAPIKTSGELVRLIERVYQGKKAGRLHPATRTFAALRIAVNLELENLERVLPQTVDLLKRGGRLAVISFHSGEDRIVKEFFRKGQKEGIFAILTKKPVRPGQEEVRQNPRSRSAKLRAAEKRT